MKITQFSQVLYSLLELILVKSAADEDLFEEFDFKDEQDEDFDDFFMIRRDYGKLIQVICRCCGGSQIYNDFFKTKLEQAV